LPSPGRIVALRAPSGPGIRDDGWVESDTEVPIFYDSLLSKVIAWGEDRRQATARMRRALSEYEIQGVRSTLAFSRWLLARPEFVEARFHTRYLDELLQQRAGEPFDEVDPSLEEVAAVAAGLAEAAKHTASTLVAQSGPGKPGLPTGAAGPLPEHPEVTRAGRSWRATARKESLRA
jgi:acetyl-CoA carboxylase biotin carboxylase subunit